MASKTSRLPKVKTKCPHCGRRMKIRAGRPYEYRNGRKDLCVECPSCGTKAWLNPKGAILMVKFGRRVAVRIVRRKGSKSSKKKTSRKTSKKVSKKLVAARKRVSKAETALKKAKNRAKRLVASRKTEAGKKSARKTSARSVAFFEKRLDKAKSAASKLQAPPRKSKRSSSRLRRATASEATKIDAKTRLERKELDKEELAKERAWVKAFRAAMYPSPQQKRAKARARARRLRLREEEAWKKGTWPRGADGWALGMTYY